MKKWVLLVSFSLLLSLTAACSGGTVEETQPKLAGPALVMFYTDT